MSLLTQRSVLSFNKKGRGMCVREKERERNKERDREREKGKKEA